MSSFSLHPTVFPFFLLSIVHAISILDPRWPRPLPKRHWPSRNGTIRPITGYLLAFLLGPRWQRRACRESPLFEPTPRCNTCVASGGGTLISAHVKWIIDLRNQLTIILYTKQPGSISPASLRSGILQKNDSHSDRRTTRRQECPESLYQCRCT